MSAFECGPCGKTFSGVMPYSQHLVSDKHKKKLRASGIDPTVPAEITEIAKKASKVCAAKYHCSTCDVDLLTKDEADNHLTSKAHKKRCGEIGGDAVQKINEILAPKMSLEESEFIEKLLKEHRRSFFVCPVSKPFIEFINENNIFPETLGDPNSTECA